MSAIFGVVKPRPGIHVPKIHQNYGGYNFLHDHLFSVTKMSKKHATGRKNEFRTVRWMLCLLSERRLIRHSLRACAGSGFSASGSQVCFSLHCGRVTSPVRSPPFAFLTLFFIFPIITAVTTNLSSVTFYGDIIGPDSRTQLLNFLACLFWYTVNIRICFCGPRYFRFRQ